MQTIYLIDLKDIKYVGEQVFIPIMQKIKQGKPANHIYPFSFKTYPKNTKSGVAAHQKRYIENTNFEVKSDKVFTSYTKLIKPWCKTVMELGGVDIKKYSTHSNRSAAYQKQNLWEYCLKTLSNVQGGGLRKHLLSITTSKSRKSQIFVFSRVCKYCDDHIGLYC